jgi:acyl-coenzyme A thioesterase PaaI-like protein
MTVNYLAAAEGVDLTAEARIVRRGRSVVFVEVDVSSPDRELVARGTLVYKLSGGR